MSFIRVKVPLLPVERDALIELAGKERRRTEAQAAWLIRQGLEKRNLLPAETNKLQTAVKGGTNEPY